VGVVAVGQQEPVGQQLAPWTQQSPWVATLATAQAPPVKASKAINARQTNHLLNMNSSKSNNRIRNDVNAHIRGPGKYFLRGVRSR
jgi:hypothetical protein